MFVEVLDCLNLTTSQTGECFSIIEACRLVRSVQTACPKLARYLGRKHDSNVRRAQQFSS
jgi:hypothetical protein